MDAACLCPSWSPRGIPHVECRATRECTDYTRTPVQGENGGMLHLLRVLLNQNGLTLIRPILQIITLPLKSLPATPIQTDTTCNWNRKSHKKRKPLEKRKQRKIMLKLKKNNFYFEISLCVLNIHWNLTITLQVFCENWRSNLYLTVKIRLVDT